MIQNIETLDKLGIKYKCYSFDEILKGVPKLEPIKDFLSLSGAIDGVTFVKIVDPNVCAVDIFHFWGWLFSRLDTYDDCVFLFVTNLRMPIPGDTRSSYWNSCMQMVNYYKAFGWYLFNPGNKLTFESVFILRTDAAIAMSLADGSQTSEIFKSELMYPSLVHPAFYTQEEIAEYKRTWDLVDSKVCNLLYSFGIVLPEKRFSTYTKEAVMSRSVKYAFGIDLGTTNSCIAVCKKNSPPQIIQLKKNATSKYKVATLPSCVMYTDDGIVVGSDAYNKRYDKAHVVYSSKRDIGSDTVYSITTADGVKTVTPVDVAAEILSSLKHSAEEMYGEVKDVTITVPAYFEADARHATIEAATKAGLNVLALINEPTAAALNYASGSKGSERILVYDLGGGTFDVTLLDISRTDSDGLADIFGEAESSGVYTKVLSTGGNRCLGGDDLDRLVAEAVIARSADNFAAEHPEVTKPLDRFLKEDYPAAFEKIILIAEQIKKRLDSDDNAAFCDAIIDDPEICPISFRVSFTETVFIDAAKEIFSRTTDIIEQCFKRAQISYKSVDRVVLIGGSTKLSHIRAALTDFMVKRGLSADQIYSNINPDEAVALGASINSAIYYGDSEMMISDVLSQSIGIAEKTMIGERVSNDQYHKLIARNSSIPQSITYTTTVEANQTEAHILVYQGDDPLLENNTHIGTVTLTVPCVNELQNVEITFMIDASGSLSITAESAGNSVTAKLENVLRPANTQKKAGKRTTALSRLSNSLAMYASTQDREIGEDLINRFASGDSTVSMADIRKFVNTATAEAVAAEQERLHQELSVAASATNVFKASGDSMEDDDESDE